MGFASRKDLQDLFLSGTFRKSVTINFPEIYGSPSCPPEALVADADGKVVGECWTCDLEELVMFGEEEYRNTGRLNPNLNAVRQALAIMKDIRKDMLAEAQKAAEPPLAKILPFPTVARSQDNHYGDAGINPFSNPAPSLP